jgi:hypothetical protein
VDGLAVAEDVDAIDAVDVDQGPAAQRSQRGQQVGDRALELVDAARP